MTLRISFGKNVVSCDDADKFGVAKRMVETFTPQATTKFPVHKIGLRVAQLAGPSVVCTSEENWRTSLPSRQTDGEVEVVVLAPSGSSIQILMRKDLDGSCNAISVVSMQSMRKLGDIVIDMNRPPTLTELEDMIAESVQITPHKIFYRTVESEKIPIEGGADIAAFCADAAAFRESITILVDCTVAPSVVSSTSMPSAPLATMQDVAVNRAKDAAPARVKATPVTVSAPPQNTAPPTSGDSGAEFVSISFQCNPPVVTLVGDIEQSELVNMAEQILEKCIGARAALYKTRPTFESLGIVGGQPAYRLELSRANFDDVHEMQMILVCLDTMDKFEQYRVVPMDGLTDIHKTLHQTAAERNRTALTLGSTKPAPLLQPGVPAKRFVEFFFIAKSH